MPEENESNLATPTEPVGLTQELLEEARQSDPRTAKPEEKKPEEPEPEKDEAAEGDDAAADESEGEGEAEESGEPEKPMGLWDKERQARDQESANERKALLAEVAELKKKVATVSTAAEKKAEKTGDKDDAAKADAIADIEAQALALADSIDADADAAAIGKAVKGGMAKMFAAIKSLKTEHGDSADVRALKAKLEGIESTLTEKAAADAATKKAEAEHRAQESLNAHIKGLDEQYGARYHNAAIKIARAKMEEDGFSEARRPSLAYEKRIVELALVEAAGKHVKKASPNKGARSDSITGGQAPNREYIKPGSLADVKRQILASKRK